MADERDGNAGTEGSGLHDLRALAARCAQATPAGRRSEPELFRAPSWAPAAPAAPIERAPRRPWAAAIAAGVVSSAVSILALAAVPSVIAPREPAASAVVAPLVKTPIVVAPEDDTTTAIEPEVVTVPSEPPSAPVDRPIARPTHRARTSAVPEPVDRAPAREPSISSAEVSPSAADDELGGVIDAALRGRTDAPAGEALPETPSAHAVTAALRALAGDIATCREGDGGTVSTRVIIDGATGTVRRVEVIGADGAVSACVAEHVETARFPRFARDEFAVSFPYRI